MVRTRREGFTLIELLVVIAIIGILAAMLFPVFARARESARKIQCLSNVKNIALAINMYLTDYDRFPPSEHRQEALLYFNDFPGDPGRDRWNGTFRDDYCGTIQQADPYLQWPVILDEYVKNRDVWRCPSARLQSGARFIYADPDWLRELRQNEGSWGSGADLPGPCEDSFPNGWGGVITDSIRQASYAADREGTGASNAFVQSIATDQIYLMDVNPSTLGDAASAAVAADGGPFPGYLTIGLLAYPDICSLECGNCAGWADWENCSSYCSDIYSYAPIDGSLLRDPSARRPYTRHLGGSNIGYLDGHAKWMDAQAIVSDFTKYANGDPNTVMNGDYIGWWGPPCWCGGSSKEWAANSGNQPTLIVTNY